LKALGGTSDILPEESERWQRIEEDARRIFKLYGYREIRTPLIEETSVFTRSLGEAAEIVTKQMYLLQDRGGRGGRSVALRPEGTASVVRALNEQGLDKTGGLIRWYYLGPMFRAERPQAGRRRQFHQIGVEVFGSASPFQDVEVLLLLRDLLQAWRIQGYALKLNSLGCRADRKKMVELALEKLKPHRARLCKDCQVRLTKNPLRILDCKEKSCQQLAGDMDLSEAVCPECRSHFDAVTKTLRDLQIPFEQDPHLVRGLDYYTRTCFEAIHPGLGAQNALGGGGRYDDLVEQMGGVQVPAVGFAVGLERVLMAQGKESQAVDSFVAGAQVFVATVAASDIPEAIRLAQQLRERGICATANLEDRPLKRQMEQASKWGCRFVLIRGEAEQANRVVTLKDMSARSQREVPEGEWLKAIKEQLTPC
jgi:histidyl-tRNA synthetase